MLLCRSPTHSLSSPPPQLQRRAAFRLLLQQRCGCETCGRSRRASKKSLLGTAIRGSSGRSHNTDKRTTQTTDDRRPTAGLAGCSSWWIVAEPFGHAPCIHPPLPPAHQHTPIRCDPTRQDTTRHDTPAAASLEPHSTLGTGYAIRVSLSAHSSRPSSRRSLMWTDVPPVRRPPSCRGLET